MEKFYSVGDYAENLIEIEKSKFITYVKPVDTEEEATEFIEYIKKKNYNATHNVSAFYIRQNKNYKKYSDDGEPSGTAGMPILQTLVNKNIIDICVVVTRYFGGIKLGTGGLVRAYTDSLNKCLEVSNLLEYNLMKKYKATFSYDYFGSIQHLFQKNNILVYDIQYMENISMDIIIFENQENILQDLVNLTSSNIIIKDYGSKYFSTIENKVISSKEIIDE